MNLYRIIIGILIILNMTFAQQNSLQNFSSEQMLQVLQNQKQSYTKRLQAFHYLLKEEEYLSEIAEVFAKEYNNADATMTTLTRKMLTELQKGKNISIWTHIATHSLWNWRVAAGYKKNEQNLTTESQVIARDDLARLVDSLMKVDIESLINAVNNTQKTFDLDNLQNPLLEYILGQRVHKKWIPTLQKNNCVGALWVLATKEPLARQAIKELYAKKNLSLQQRLLLLTYCSFFVEKNADLPLEVTQLCLKFLLPQLRGEIMKLPQKYLRDLQQGKTKSVQTQLEKFFTFESIEKIKFRTVKKNVSWQVKLITKKKSISEQPPYLLDINRTDNGIVITVHKPYRILFASFMAIQTIAKNTQETELWLPMMLKLAEIKGIPGGLKMQALLVASNAMKEVEQKRQFLVKNLQHPQTLVRIYAALLLLTLDPSNSEEAVQLILHEFKTQNNEVRLQIVPTMIISPQLMPHLLSVAKDKDVRIRQATIESLFKLLVSGKSPQQHMQTVKTIFQNATNDKKMLKSAKSSQDLAITICFSNFVLGNITLEKALPTLVKIKSSHNFQLKSVLLNLMKRYARSKDRNVVKFFLALTTDVLASFRWEAIAQLDEVSRFDYIYPTLEKELLQKIIIAVRKRLQDRSLTPQLTAAIMLLNCKKDNDGQGIARMCELLPHMPEKMCTSVLHRIKDEVPRVKELKPLIGSLLQHSKSTNREIAKATTEILHSIGSRALPHLQKLATAKNEQLRAAAKEILEIQKQRRLMDSDFNDLNWEYDKWEGDEWSMEEDEVQLDELDEFTDENDDRDEGFDEWENSDEIDKFLEEEGDDSEGDFDNLSWDDQG